MEAGYARFKESLDSRPPAGDFEIEKILNVYYLHVKCGNDGDLYVTLYGLPSIEILAPCS